MDQEYTSANTSMNKTKVPKLFSKVEQHFGWSNGKYNLDIGGGKFNTATEFLQELGVVNFIYDTFNRSDTHNQYVDDISDHLPISTVTLSNVLNVIKELEIRLELLYLAEKKLLPGGVLYISNYKSGKEGQSKKDCWQTNMTMADYLQEVQIVFPKAYTLYGIIVATKN